MSAALPACLPGGGAALCFHMRVADTLTLRPPAFRFFKELEERHQQSIVIDSISDIVGQHAESNFDPYIKYCSNEVYQQRTLQRLV